MASTGVIHARKEAALDLEPWIEGVELAEPWGASHGVASPIAQNEDEEEEFDDDFMEDDDEFDDEEDELEEDDDEDDDDDDFDVDDDE